jgi:hypothetical protein
MIWHDLSVHNVNLANDLMDRARALKANREKLDARKVA